MKVRDLLKKEEQIFSLEFFPPKTEEAMDNLLEAVEELKESKPSYVSITYGALGTTRDKTVELVSAMKNRFGLEPMAHLTCVGSTVDFIRQILDTYKDGGVENILALRGDPPVGDKEFKRPANGFGYASELTLEIKQNYDFSVGVAGYPECHIESKNMEEDLKYLKLKVDSGADFIITQLFYDNLNYFNFVKKAKEIGITAPIIPGIMPISNLKQISKITSMCGAKIPDALQTDLEKIKDDPKKVEQYGIEYAIGQCRELLDNGAPGIHFYTLNKSKAILSILRELHSKKPN